jgi:hypothetical protein
MAKKLSATYPTLKKLPPPLFLHTYPRQVNRTLLYHISMIKVSYENDDILLHLLSLIFAVILRYIE